MRNTRRFVAIALVCVTLLSVAGCAASGDRQQSAATKFLRPYKLALSAQPTRFPLTVPADWQVHFGEYPTGLFWALANEYSKDVGLDLAAAKGKQADAFIFELTDGLPGEGGSTGFRYPSSAVVIVVEGKPVGAWLAVNKWSPGPSLKQRYLKDITGKDPTDWLVASGYLLQSERNADLAELSPPDVIRAFFAAVNAGDAERANACLAPSEMLSALFTNKSTSPLYNDRYTAANSYTENILSGQLLSYSFLDPMTIQRISSIEDRTRIEVAAEVEIVWREEWANTPDHRQTRFVTMSDQGFGWKIEGFGTGP